MAGEVLTDGMMNPGDVKNTNGLEGAAEIAEKSDACLNDAAAFR